MPSFLQFFGLSFTSQSQSTNRRMPLFLIAHPFFLVAIEAGKAASLLHPLHSHHPDQLTVKWALGMRA
jgi:hypothetical protein